MQYFVDIYLHGILAARPTRLICYSHKIGMTMFNTRLRSLIRKEFIQIRRDKRTLILVLIIPIMQLFLMGYAATNDVRNVPLVVYDQDRGSKARALLDAYRAADYFTITYEANSEEELRNLIDAGKARAGLIIPPNYSDKITAGESGQVMIVLDGSDPTIASTALSSAQLIGQAYSTQILEERLANRGQTAAIQAPVQVGTTVWYNPDLVSAYFMIPGVIGMILFALTSILSASAIVRERERGTIEQLIVTPIRPWELVVGKLLPYVLLAFFNAFEVLAIGHYWFKVPIHGSLLAAIWCVIFVLTLQPGHWSAGLHDRQHPAGSHVDRLDAVAAQYLPGRFLFPSASDAKNFTMDFIYYSH